MLCSHVYRPDLLHRRPDSLVTDPSSYFEGFYFKFVTADMSQSVAVIPGFYTVGSPAAQASVSSPGLNHSTSFMSFIMVLHDKQANLYTRPLDAFHVPDYAGSDDKLQFDVDGDNVFTSSSMSLNLTPSNPVDDATATVEGRLWWDADNQVQWPVSSLSVGAMGPFGLLPFLECYHGVLSMSMQSLHGSLTIDGEEVDFEGGFGYLEKDWGSGFPSAWIWTHAFFPDSRGTSFFLSLARVPLHVTNLPGFLASLYHDGELHLFSTFTFAAVTSMDVSESTVVVVLEGSGKTLEVTMAIPEEDPQLLYMPTKKDGMVKRVAEHIKTTIGVRLVEGKDNVLFDQTGVGSLEVEGNVQWIVDNVVASSSRDL